MDGVTGGVLFLRILNVKMKEIVIQESGINENRSSSDLYTRSPYTSIAGYRWRYDM